MEPQDCYPNTSTSTVARRWSNKRATAHSATLHGAGSPQLGAGGLELHVQRLRVARLLEHDLEPGPVTLFFEDGKVEARSVLHTGFTVFQVVRSVVSSDLSTSPALYTVFPASLAKLGGFGAWPRRWRCPRRCRPPCTASAAASCAAPRPSPPARPAHRGTRPRAPGR